jgi:hypothetical protein
LVVHRPWQKFNNKETKKRRKIGQGRLGDPTRGFVSLLFKSSSGGYPNLQQPAEAAEQQRSQAIRATGATGSPDALTIFLLIFLLHVHFRLLMLTSSKLVVLNPNAIQPTKKVKI